MTLQDLVEPMKFTVTWPSGDVEVVTTSRLLITEDGVVIPCDADGAIDPEPDDDAGHPNILIGAQSHG